MQSLDHGPGCDCTWEQLVPRDDGYALEYGPTCAAFGAETIRQIQTIARDLVAEADAKLAENDRQTQRRLEQIQIRKDMAIARIQRNGEHQERRVDVLVLTFMIGAIALLAAILGVRG